ncbi:MAG: DMT family transporter [Candidatus Bathyarchaeota archaeon]|nr:DMT family transporter [Candidatus Bathyarchaeota archaeon]
MFANKTKAVVFTILAGVLWGTSFPIIKIGLATIDPFAFLFWRFFVSSLILVIILVLFKKFQFCMSDKKFVVFLGVINGSGYLLQYVGMPYTTSAKAALYINLSAMWVALLSPKLLGEHISPKKAVGVISGLLGVVFVSTNLDFYTLSQGQIMGDCILIISGVTWALFMIYNKKFLMNSTSGLFQSMSGVLFFTFLAVAPFGVLAGSALFALDIWAWAAIVYQAIVCWLIPYYLWLEGLKHLSASTSTILLLSEIIIATVASVLILKEPMSIFSAVGALLIVLAIVLVSVKDHSTKKLKFCIFSNYA